MFVVFLHGPPAAGKFTIGKLLSEALKVPLFHNHLTVDLVQSLFDFGSDGFNSLRASIWCDAFATAARAGRSFIFTFHPESSVDPTLIPTLQRIVEDCAGQVHYIELACATEALLQRLDDPQRRAFGKLRDKALFRHLQESGAFDFPALPAALLRIDTDRHNPQQAASHILEALRDRAGLDQ